MTNGRRAIVSYDVAAQIWPIAHLWSSGNLFYLDFWNDCKQGVKQLTLSSSVDASVGLITVASLIPKSVGNFRGNEDEFSVENTSSFCWHSESL